MEASKSKSEDNTVPSTPLSDSMDASMLADIDALRLIEETPHNDMNPFFSYHMEKAIESVSCIDPVPLIDFNFCRRIFVITLRIVSFTLSRQAVQVM
jgi:hypothetical protein